MTAAGVPAARVKLLCLVVVLAAGVATAVGVGSDLAVMLAVVGVGLFIGLALVPMSQVSAQVRLPAAFAGLFVAQSVAIAVFVLLQPVGASGSGSQVGLLALFGDRPSHHTGLAQSLALVGLVTAIGCCLAAFVALRRQTRRADWVRPPRGAVGFFAEGDKASGRRS